MKLVTFNLDALTTIFTDLNVQNVFGSQPLLRYCTDIPTTEDEWDTFMVKVIDSVLEWGGVKVTGIKVDPDAYKGAPSKYSVVEVGCVPGLTTFMDGREFKDKFQLMVDDAIKVLYKNDALAKQIIETHDKHCGASKGGIGNMLAGMGGRAMAIPLGAGGIEGLLSAIGNLVDADEGSDPVVKPASPLKN